MDAEIVDLDAVRADTPAALHQVFLDSAGSSLTPTPVLDVQLAHLRREAEIGGYRAAAERADDLEAGYGVLAELLGADVDEIAFSDSATRSWLGAFDAVPLAAGDRVLITEVEYAGNAVPLLRRAEETGAVVEVVPSDAHGQVDLAALRDLLDERVKLVSVVHVPTNGGVVNPVAEIAAAAHEVGALVLLDACQSIGQFPVGLRDLGVDILSGTGRKWLRGPRGTGVLAVRREVLPRLRPRLVDLRSGEWTSPTTYRLRDDARVFELWESSVAAKLGLIEAAKYALGIGVDIIEAEVGDRAKRLRAGLADLPGVQVRDLGERRCGLVTFTVDGMTATEAKAALAEQGVVVTASYVSSTRIDMAKRGLDEVVRASPHYFVSPEQVDQAVAAVSRIGR